MSELDDRRTRINRLVKELRDEVRGWTDANEGDPGIALVELLAWMGDALTRYTEIVANEAYLGTAGSRASVEVEIGGEHWQRVESLGESGPDDRHFMASDREDGATVVEFGDGEHGRRPSADDFTRFTYRRGRRYSSVEMQQGRVILDADWGGAGEGKFHAFYRGRVVDATDPLRASRLRVQVPTVLGTDSIWAAASLPPVDPAQVVLPSVGDLVWVCFEDGDVDNPVWLGTMHYPG